MHESSLVFFSSKPPNDSPTCFIGNSVIRRRKSALGYPILIRQEGLSLKLSCRCDVSRPWRDTECIL